MGMKSEASCASGNFENPDQCGPGFRFAELNPRAATPPAPNHSIRVELPAKDAADLRLNRRSDPADKQNASGRLG